MASNSLDGSYRILDEPRASGLAQLVVNPLWPLLALMLAGSWLALPWFALNAFALGSATRVRETLLVLSWAPLLFALLWVLGALRLYAGVPAAAMPYLAILITVAKLALGYALLTLQQRSFALFEYFGGQVRNGAIVVMAGTVLGRDAVMGRFAEPSFWALLAG
jgi:hypothetical protein